jgi:hypothetical protein
MATIAQLVGRSWNKRRERKIENERRANPLDRDLPLGLHDDGKIELRPFLPEGMLMPDLGRFHIIQGWSVSAILGNRVNRITLLSEAGDKFSYLWIWRDGHETSLRWFVPLDEEYPKDDAEWHYWIHDGDGAIGYPAFQTKMGIGHKNGVLLPRIWQKSDSWVPPVHVEETVYPDRYDASQSFKVQHDLMLYGRSVQNETLKRDEYILLSSQEDPDGSRIAIDVGIDLDPKADMKVVY